MILKFSTENFRSIQSVASASLVATSLLELRDSLIASRYAKYGVTPVMALYGSNASGKSNFLEALAFMRSVVLQSFQHGQADALIPVKPFLLDEQSRDQPSTFVLDFVMHDVRYQLGFSLTRERVTEEWLYTYPKRSQQVLYHRSVDADTEYHFGRGLGGSNRQIQNITRSNALFISTAAASTHPVLTQIWHYFKDNLVIELSPSTSSNARLAQQLSADKNLLRDAAKYLAMADTGISDVRIQDKPVPDSTKTRLNELYQVIGKLAGEPLRAELLDADRTIELGHNGADNSIHYLEFEDESLGTQYLFSLLPALLTAIDGGKVLVLDEITTSLHTHLTRCLVRLFSNKETNPHGAQLIFSTHDTNLLSPGLLRRDEVWLTEKSTQGITTVTPLSDYKTKITDNIERGYLQGRFGAVPYLRGTLKNESK